MEEKKIRGEKCVIGICFSTYTIGLQGTTKKRGKKKTIQREFISPLNILKDPSVKNNIDLFYVPH